jgi:hypothetical protein
MTLADPETLSDLRATYGNHLVQLDTDLLTEVTTWWTGPGLRAYTCACCEHLVDDPIEGCVLCAEENT